MGLFSSKTRTIGGETMEKEHFKKLYGGEWRKYWKAWKKEAKGNPEKAEAIRTGTLAQWRKDHGLIGKVAGALTWVTLIPFKKGMTLWLKAKGIEQPPTDTPTLAAMFHDIAIKKGDTFEDVYAFEETFTYMNDPYTHRNYETVSTLDPVIISVIVSAILALFKGLKEKSDRGEVMPDWQKDVVNVTQREIDAVKTQQTTEAIGEFIQANGLIIAVVIVALLFFKK